LEDEAIIEAMFDEAMLVYEEALALSLLPPEEEEEEEPVAIDPFAAFIGDVVDFFNGTEGNVTELLDEDLLMNLLVMPTLEDF
jgi:hypothetical protein